MNLKKYRNELKKHEEKYNNYKNGIKLNSEYSFNILIADSVNIAGDSVALTRYNRSIKKLKKDIYVNEAVNVICDM